MRLLARLARSALLALEQRLGQLVCLLLYWQHVTEVLCERHRYGMRGTLWGGIPPAGEKAASCAKAAHLQVSVEAFALVRVQLAQLAHLRAGGTKAEPVGPSNWVHQAQATRSATGLLHLPQLALQILARRVQQPCLHGIAFLRRRMVARRQKVGEATRNASRHQRPRHTTRRGHLHKPRIPPTVALSRLARASASSRFSSLIRRSRSS